LIFTGHFGVWQSFLLVVPGDVIPDIFYFLVGKNAHKYPRIQRWIAKSPFLTKHLTTMNSYWVNKPWITTLLGKS
jgi:hypothetical protein